MYVIVEINGQQFKAEQGKKLFVHHLRDVESGATVEFDKVLLVDADGGVAGGNTHGGRRQGDLRSAFAVSQGR